MSDWARRLDFAHWLGQGSARHQQQEEAYARTSIALVLAVWAANAFANESKISSLAIGAYRPGEAEQLSPAFINAVNRYLHRYEPRLIERNDTYVKMMVDYDYDYAVELRVREKDYEVTVTLAEKTKRIAKAQSQAAKLASGVHVTMEKFLLREARSRGN